MSESVEGQGELFVVIAEKGSDGRLRQVGVIPDPPQNSDRTYVLVYEGGETMARWMLPEDAGFSATPMIMNVPMTHPDGYLMTDGDGAILTTNVPSV